VVTVITVMISKVADDSGGGVDSADSDTVVVTVCSDSGDSGD
jgi:hypothetical protein